jgi:hypothetical protein
MHRVMIAGAIVVCLCVATVDAHHAIAAIYDSTRPQTLEGTVIQFQFTSPHPFVVIEAAAGDRANQQWRLEMDNRSELAAVGMTAETLKKGDRIVVSGSMARDQSRSLYIRRLDRPSDGFWYEQAGSSPRAGRSRSPR